MRKVTAEILMEMLREASPYIYMRDASIDEDGSEVILDDRGDFKAFADKINQYFQGE